METITGVQIWDDSKQVTKGVFSSISSCLLRKYFPAASNYMGKNLTFMPFLNDFMLCMSHAKISQIREIFPFPPHIAKFYFKINFMRITKRFPKAFTHTLKKFWLIVPKNSILLKVTFKIWKQFVYRAWRGGGKESKLVDIVVIS